MGRVIKPVALTDAMLISSTVPENDYAAWGEFTPNTGGMFSVSGGTITKLAPQGWNAHLFSSESYPAHVFCCGKFVSGGYQNFGFSTSQNNTPSFDSVNYSFYADYTGVLRIYINAAPVYTGTVNRSATYSIVYDGINVVFFVDGVSLHSVARSVSGVLYFDLVSYSAGEVFSAVTYGSTFSSVGQRCISRATHAVYERAVAGSGITPPQDSLTGTNPTWLYVGPTNRWAMFDEEISTATVGATALTVVFQPGACSGLALFGLVGSSVTVSMTHSGTTVYTVTKPLQEVIASNWYEYLFGVPQQVQTVTLTDLPVYRTGIITVSVTGSSPSCGACVFGIAYGIGGTKRGANFGIKSYSKIITDTWGKTTFFKRKRARPMSLILRVDNRELTKIAQLLDGLESTICVWIGSDTDGELDVLTVLGWFEDFSVAIPYKTYSDMTLKIQGTI